MCNNQSVVSSAPDTAVNILCVLLLLFTKMLVGPQCSQTTLKAYRQLKINLKVKLSLYWPTGPKGSSAQNFQSAHEGGKVSALRTGCLYPPGKISGTNFC